MSSKRKTIQKKKTAFDYFVQEQSKPFPAMWEALEDKSKYEALADKGTVKKENPWIRFSKVEHARLKGEGMMDFGERSKLCGEKWKAFTAEEKKQWEAPTADADASTFDSVA